MVGNPPSGRDLSAGASLLARLEKGGLPIDAAAWLHDPDTDRWTLNIVSGWYEDGLPRPFKTMSDLLEGEGAPSSTSTVGLDDVAAVPASSELGRALISLKPLAQGEPRRVDDRLVSGVFIPRAVLYDLAA